MENNENGEALHGESEDCPGCKNTTEDNEESSTVQKGRFCVENPQSNNITETQSGQEKKGRFEITDTLGTDRNKSLYKFHKSMDGLERTDTYFEILDYQNRQIELLFDMIKNIAGEDKLFHREFIALANEVYEKLEVIRRIRKS